MKKIKQWVSGILIAGTLIGCGSGTSGSTAGINNKNLIPIEKIKLNDRIRSTITTDEKNSTIFICLDDKTIGIFNKETNYSLSLISKYNLNVEDSDGYCTGLAVKNNKIVAIDNDGNPDRDLGGLYLIDISDINNPNLLDVNRSFNFEYNGYQDNIVHFINDNTVLVIDNNRYNHASLNKINISENNLSIEKQLDLSITYNGDIDSMTITPDDRIFIARRKSNYDYKYLDEINGSTFEKINSINVDNMLAKVKALNNNYLIAIDEEDPGHLYVFNISNPNNVFIVKTINNTHNGNFYDFFVDGKYLYVLSENSIYSDNIYIDKFDISDIQNPKLVTSKLLEGYEFSKMKLIDNKVYLYNLGGTHIYVVNKDDI